MNNTHDVIDLGPAPTVEDCCALIDRLSSREGMTPETQRTLVKLLLPAFMAIGDWVPENHLSGVSSLLGKKADAVFQLGYQAAKREQREGKR